MATSLLSRRLFSGPTRLPSPSLRPFSITPGAETFSSHDHDTFTSPDRDTFTSPDTTSSRQIRNFEPRLLEGGMDPGFYRAILVGKVGQAPIQRTLRSGHNIVLFSLATGGIRNRRQPLPHERPEEFDARCKVQWHRVCVYPERFLPIAMKTVKPG
jgi:single-strand DNA-binding protein